MSLYKTEIESDFRFFWKLFFSILRLPITFVEVLFKKKEFSDLLEPLKSTLHFILEPKFALIISIINIAVFFVLNYGLVFGKISIDFINKYFILNSFDILNSNYYSIFGSMFMHASLVHLFSNVFALLIFGRIVERKLGFKKTAFVFFGAGIVSNIIYVIYHLIINSNVGALGMSGCIMGLVALAVLIDPLYLCFETGIPLPVSLIGFFLIYSDFSNLFYSSDNISHISHIAGFFSIMLLAFFLNKEEKETMKKNLIFDIVMVVIAVVLYLLLRSRMII